MGVDAVEIRLKRLERRKGVISYSFFSNFLTWFFSGFADETIDLSSEIVLCTPREANRACIGFHDLLKKNKKGKEKRLFLIEEKGGPGSLRCERSSDFHNRIWL